MELPPFSSSPFISALRPQLPSSSPGISALRPHHQAASSHRTKRRNKPIGVNASDHHVSLPSPPPAQPFGQKCCSELTLNKLFLKPNDAASLSGARACGKFEPEKSDSALKRISNCSGVFVGFCRPFAIRSTTVMFMAVLARTWAENPHLLKLEWSLLLKILALLVAMICGDGYIGGINQIFDLEIDRINKPYLPIAAGDLSLESAWLLVTGCVGIGILAATMLNSRLFLAWICCIFLFGHLYSVPPVRFKTSTIGAVLWCSMRGFLSPFALTTGVRAILGLPFQLSSPLAFFAIFLTLSYVAHAAIKDLEDVEGDKKYSVPTLAVTYGVRKVALVSCGILLLNYVGAMLLAVFMPQAFKRSIMIPAHAVMAIYLSFRAWKLDKANYSKEESKTFQQLSWKLVDAECAIFPFI